MPAWFVVALRAWRAKQLGLNHLLGLGVKPQGLVLAMHPHPYDLPTYTLAGDANKGLGRVYCRGKARVRSCCARSPLASSYFITFSLLILSVNSFNL